MDIDPTVSFVLRVLKIAFIISIWHEIKFIVTLDLFREVTFL